MCWLALLHLLHARKFERVTNKRRTQLRENDTTLPKVRVAAEMRLYLF
jgi:hypothetical protein